MTDKALFIAGIFAVLTAVAMTWAIPTGGPPHDGVWREVTAPKIDIFGEKVPGVWTTIMPDGHVCFVLMGSVPDLECL